MNSRDNDKSKSTRKHLQGKTNKWSEILLGMVMGVIGGLSAVALSYLIDGIEYLIFALLIPEVSWIVNGYNLTLLFMPVIGSIFIVLIFYRKKMRKEIQGSGIPYILEKVTLEGADISPRVGVEKLIASGITLGTGGSAGKEGPIALIGGSFSSYLAKKFNLSQESKRTLVVCGLAAGIAGIFHSPIGGALFGIEILLQGISLIHTIPIFISSAIGTLVTRYLMDEHYGEDIFHHVDISMSNIGTVDIFLILFLAVILGLLGILWVEFLTKGVRSFGSWNIPHYLKPIFGSLLTGVILIFTFEDGIGGPGMDGIEKALDLQMTIALLFLLGFLKMVATTSTLSSGNSGGIFGPTLYIGCMFGVGFGAVFALIFPNQPIDPRLYGLIGMAVVFAASTQAPLNISLMIAEITNNIDLIPLLLLASIIGYLISRSQLKENNIYTRNLKEQGVLITKDSSYILNRVKLRNAMSKKIISVSPELSLDEFASFSQDHSMNQFPVLNLDESTPLGVIKKNQIWRVPFREWKNKKIKHIMDKDFQIIDIMASLQSALDKMEDDQISYLLVVEAEKEEPEIGDIGDEDEIKGEEIEKKKSAEEDQEKELDIPKKTEFNLKGIITKKDILKLLEKGVKEDK